MLPPCKRLPRSALRTCRKNSPFFILVFVLALLSISLIALALFSYHRISALNLIVEDYHQLFSVNQTEHLSVVQQAHLSAPHGRNLLLPCECNEKNDLRRCHFRLDHATKLLKQCVLYGQNGEKQIQDLGAEIGRLHVILATLDGQKQECELTKVDLEEQVTELFEELNSTRAESEELKHQNAVLQQERDELANQVSQLNTSNAKLEKEVVALLSQIDDLSSLVSKFQTMTTQLEAENVALASEISELQAIQGELAENVIELYNATQELSNEVSHLDGVRIELNHTVQQLEVDLRDTAEIAELLTEEASRLANNVKELEDHNEELQTNLDNATAQIAALQIRGNTLELQVDGLTAQLLDCVASRDEVNASVSELEAARDNLTARVEDLWQDLNETKTQCDAQIANLTYLLGDCQMEEEALESALDNATSLVVTFQSRNAELEARKLDLEDRVANLTEQVDDLNVMLDGLESVSSYLENKAASTNEEDYDTLLNRLQLEITLNRANALYSLRSFFDDATSFWNCDVANTFPDAPWLTDSNLEVGEDLARLLDVVDTRVLQVLCLDLDEFETFLLRDDGSSLETIRYRHVQQSAVLYAAAAMDYYFAEQAGGISPEEWEAAEYDCHNVPQFAFSH